MGAVKTFLLKNILWGFFYCICFCGEWAQAQDEEPCTIECDLQGDCKAGTHPGLREALSKGEIPSLALTKGGEYDPWSSSMLAPSGKDPSLGKKCPQMEHEDWTCKYSAQRAQDNDPKTAWVEGMKGTGIGEVLLVKLDTQKPAEIWSGYGASEILHKANARPKSVKIYVLQATKAEWLGQCGTQYKAIRVLAQHEIELKDKNGNQPLPLPKHTLAFTSEAEPPLATFVAVEILSVYPGKKYEDTCISEIRNIE